MFKSMKAMPDNTLGNDGLGKEFNKVFLELKNT